MHFSCPFCGQNEGLSLAIDHLQGPYDVFGDSSKIG